VLYLIPSGLGENMKKLILATVTALMIAAPTFAAEGLIDVKSAYSVKETGDRLENVLQEKGMTIFNRIEHSASAKKVGIELAETELIIFGNPKVGSPLMKCELSVAIDLPQKALIWEDKDQQTWISYNDPKYLQKRHSIANCDELVSKIGNALAGITKAAATK
jgi:uncharacterized protein (DUF302 family)